MTKEQTELLSGIVNLWDLGYKVRLKFNKNELEDFHFKELCKIYSNDYDLGVAILQFLNLRREQYEKQ